MPRTHPVERPAHRPHGDSRQSATDLRVELDVERLGIAGRPAYLPEHRRTPGEAERQVQKAVRAENLLEPIAGAQRPADRLARTGPALGLDVARRQEQKLPVGSLLRCKHQNGTLFVDTGQVIEVRALPVAVAVFATLGIDDGYALAHLLHQGRAPRRIHGRSLGLGGFDQHRQRRVRLGGPACGGAQYEDARQQGA